MTLVLPSLGASADTSYQSGGVSLSGPLLQGGMVIGKAAPGAKAVFEKRALRVSDDGRFVIGFGRNAPRSAKLEITLADGGVSSHALEIARREYDTQRIDNLAADKVTPPPEAYARIEQDRRSIGAVRARDTALLFFLEPFVWPVRGIITGVYGVGRILNGKPRSPHYGVDIAAPVGTPAKAPAAGEVALVRDMYFSGVTMVIDHGHGVSSTMLHLDAAHARPGDRVQKGQVIGAVGASGRATGPHLDWRVNWFDQRLDPQLLVGEMPASGD